MFSFSFLLSFLSLSPLRGFVWSPFAGAGSDPSSESSAEAERITRIRFPTTLRTSVAWLVSNGDRAVSTVSAACETTTQFPRPDLVVMDARQRFWLAPPVHLVPAGNWMVNCCVSSFAGAIWAVTKFFPVPDASTWTVSIDREPSASLKAFQVQPTR